MRKTALIIENDALSRKLLADLLGMLECDVVQTRTAQDGLDMARARKPDLIVLDIKLQGMSGLDFIDYVRAEQALRDVPIIVMTAYERNDVAGYDFDEFFQKPVSVDSLLRTVHRHLYPGRPYRRAGARN
ncbi:MAG: response regulator [Alphaproteobacteria bacterium]|nr:response regulator [Alphaproteobacteria bacterium]